MYLTKAGPWGVNPHRRQVDFAKANVSGVNVHSYNKQIRGF